MSGNRANAGTDKVGTSALGLATQDEVRQAMGEVLLEILEQILDQMKTNQEEALDTNTELRYLIEYLTTRITASEDALDLARTSIAALREEDEGLKSDVSNIMVGRAELSTEVDLRFARTAESFVRVDKSLPRDAAQETEESAQEERKVRRRHAHDKDKKVGRHGRNRKSEGRHESSESKVYTDDSV